MTRLAPLLLVFVMTRVCADDPANPDKDFRTMMQWFPGVYDKQVQFYFEAGQEVDEALRHERIHHVFAPADLLAFGKQVFYVEQHLNDDPSDIYRQQIYVFRPDCEESAVRLMIHIPHYVESLVDAHLDPGKLSGLLPEQTRVLPGCDVFWRREASQFVGYMKPDACSYVSSKSGTRFIFNDGLLLTEDALWIGDRAHDEEGNRVFGHPAGVSHKNRTAGPSIELYAYRPGEDCAVLCAWTDPTAKRIGINLRWMQASGTLARA